jgi:hypothetical protein
MLLYKKWYVMLEVEKEDALGKSRPKRELLACASRRRSSSPPPPVLSRLTLTPSSFMQNLSEPPKRPLVFAKCSPSRMELTLSDMSSSFSSKRINSTTFVVREDDAFGEHPFIYVKVHPKAPILVLSDTGCDEASEKKKNGL